MFHKDTPCRLIYEHSFHNIANKIPIMLSIENEQLKIVIHPKGAELQSIFNKQNKLEYLWNGDPAFWSKKSPVLFPIVGALKKDTYFYDDKTYKLSRHGFARDMEFATQEKGPTSITFLLSSSEATFSQFPFEFEFRITYAVQDDSVRVVYRVSNTSNSEMYFSVGGHPAFKVPLVDGTVYDDYYIEFNEQETSPRWPISKDGLIENTPQPLLRDTNVLPLTKELFLNDAIVLKNPRSSIAKLRSDKTAHGFDFDFGDFPYLGIWAAKHADFVCIEPWCGIADSVDTNQQFKEKEGINRLSPKEIFERSWIASFF
jgi:galactose mutarotase-like enzyme